MASLIRLTHAPGDPTAPIACDWELKGRKSAGFLADQKPPGNWSGDTLLSRNLSNAEKIPPGRVAGGLSSGDAVRFPWKGCREGSRRELGDQLVLDVQPSS
jgi:hypothetical protein